MSSSPDINESNPLVSVILPTYNRVQSLMASIESVLNQSYQEIELIIINDCSSDGTEAFLREGPDKKKIVIINNVKNQGLQKSLNIGLKKANGHYVCRIDDDDIWLDENKIRLQVDYFEKNPKCILQGTSYKVGDSIIHNPSSDEDIRNQILFRCPFRHSTVMFPRIIDEKQHLYDETLVYSEDWELWMRLGRFGEFYNHRTVTALIAEGDNATEKFALKQLPINRQIVKANRQYYPKKIASFFYHFGLRLFFKIIPMGSGVHRFFSGIFSKTFLNS